MPGAVFYTELTMEYFFKELVSNAARLSDGREAQFESIGDDNGILQTEDAELIKMLGDLIANRRGGIVRIDKERYEELVKKKPGGPLPSRPRMSDPPAPPKVTALPDSRKLAPVVGAAARGPIPDAIKQPKPRSDAPTVKLPGFGVPPDFGTPSSPPPAEAPSGDAAVNRPVPKKVAPSAPQPPPPPKPPI